MYINNYLNYTYIFQVNLKEIEKIVVKIQNKIRQAAQICKTNHIYKWQSSFLLNKEFLLIVIRNALIFIKKK